MPPPPSSSLTAAEAGTNQRPGYHRPPGSVRYRSPRHNKQPAPQPGRARTQSAHAALPTYATLPTNTAAPLRPDSAVSNDATPACPGDAHWLRVMETKENQWRLINCLALHELHAQERAACAELDVLTARADAARERADHLHGAVATCRARRARESFARAAAPRLAALGAALDGARAPHAALCRALEDAARAVPLRGARVSSQADLAKEMCRFRDAAARFRQRAAAAGAPQLVGVCDVMEQLVDVAGAEEVAAVTCAAEAVSEAVEVVECERVILAKRIVELRSGSAFPAEPSFVE